MINEEVAELLEELADMEEIEGNRWESIAYRKAAGSIRSLSIDLEQLYRENKLREIDGVGQAIEKKIIQYITTGSIEKYLELKRKYPLDFRNLRRIQGLGPKKIYALYRSLGVRELTDLREALEKHSIASVPGFGAKSEANIASELRRLESLSTERVPLARIFDYATGIRDKLISSGKFRVVELVGSFRRMRDTVGDLDILAVSDDPASGYGAFLGLDEITGIIVKGESKVSVTLDAGVNCDFRIFNEESFGAAMQYFTGSKQHNIRLRDLAIDNGMKLNEYGLFKGETRVAGRTEEEVYTNLGMQWVPPELRENMGEIELALAGRLPSLVNEVACDMHINIPAGSSAEFMEQLASGLGSGNVKGGAFLLSADKNEPAKQSGHVNKEDMEKFLEAAYLLSPQIRENILIGAQLDLLSIAENRYPADLLARFDYIVGSASALSNDDIKSNTDLYLKAIETRLIDAIAHPTGRIIGKIPPAPIDFSRLFTACRENGVWLEINGFPERSDLPADIVRRGKDAGVKFVIGSGATSYTELRYIKFAVYIARRGWLVPEDVAGSGTIGSVRAALMKRKTLKPIK